MRIVLLLQLILFCTPFLGTSQENQALTRLNDAAFIALENSDTAVTRLANELLDASSKSNKSSVFGINAHTILGIINKDKGYYITSLNHYLKALNQAEEIHDEGRVSACFNNIGSVYQLQNNFTKSKIYFEKSLAIEEILDHPLQTSIRLYNLGEVYAKMDSFTLALSFYNRSLLIEKEQQNAEGEVYALLGISEVYIRLERFPDAGILLNEIETNLAKHQIEEQILYHKLAGVLFSKKNELDLANNALRKAESISVQNDFRIHLLDIYTEQIAVLKAQQKWHAVVLKYDTYTRLNHELNNLRVKNQLEDLTFQNELNKKELEVELIQEEKNLVMMNKEMVETTSQHRQKVVWFLVTSIFVLFGLIVLGIRKLS
ncbi:MAG: tetratricopeptide (TPR) repeat protein [Patiriisocius sp.]|jgi:tetratricopeptide (TPR) repeat protein